MIFIDKINNTHHEVVKKKRNFMYFTHNISYLKKKYMFLGRLTAAF